MAFRIEGITCMKINWVRQLDYLCKHYELVQAWLRAPVEHITLFLGFCVQVCGCRPLDNCIWITWYFDPWSLHLLLQRTAAVQHPALMKGERCWRNVVEYEGRDIAVALFCEQFFLRTGWSIMWVETYGEVTRYQVLEQPQVCTFRNKLWRPSNNNIRQSRRASWLFILVLLYALSSSAFNIKINVHWFLC